MLSSIPAAFFMGCIVAGAAMMVQFRSEPLSPSYDLGRDILGAGFIGFLGVIAINAGKALLS